MQIVNATGTVVDDSVLRAANPLVSFPAVLSNASLSEFGYTVLQLTTPPATSQFYTIAEGTPTESNGVWTQTWTSTPIALADAQASQSQTLDSQCATAIVSGFTSSALGAAHTYPSQMTDQQNLTACVVASMYPGLAANWSIEFWCADSTGTWAWTAHTAAQIQQVGLDGKTQVMAYQTQNATLQAQVLAATTVDDVAKIVWPATA